MNLIVAGKNGSNLIVHVLPIDLSHINQSRRNQATIKLVR